MLLKPAPLAMAASVGVVVRFVREALTNVSPLTRTRLSFGRLPLLTAMSGRSHIPRSRLLNEPDVKSGELVMLTPIVVAPAATLPLIVPAIERSGVVPPAA